MLKFSSLLVIAVAISVASVAAYDFKDSDFNELLFEEFQADFDDESSPLSVRSRREVTEVAQAIPAGKKECSKRDWKKDFQCCMGEKYDQEHVEAYMEVKKQCMTEVKGKDGAADEPYDPFNCEKMQKLKGQMVCVSECIAKKFQFLDEAGGLKRDVILTHLRGKIGESQWKKDAIEGFVDKCLAEVKEKKLKATEKQGEEELSGCNMCPLDFHHCLWRELANGCPADMRVKTPKCNRMRERLTRGDTSILNKHFLHSFHEKRHEE